jgi:hypothetical protein
VRLPIIPLLPRSLTLANRSFALAWSTPPAFRNIQYVCPCRRWQNSRLTRAAVCRYKTYFVYGTFCICAAINVFFMFPETKGRTLEEMDDLFAAGHAFSAWRLSSVPKKTLAEVEAEVYVFPVLPLRARAHLLPALGQRRLGHAQRRRQ